MKITFDIPAPLFRSLNEFFTQAMGDALPADPPWKKAFGGLRHLHTETKRIERVIARV